MNTHDKYPQARNSHPHNWRRGGRLALALVLLGNALGLASGSASDAQAASLAERGPSAKPELQNTKPDVKSTKPEKKQPLKPTATAIYGYGKEAVRVPLKLTYKKGVLRAHDVQRDEAGTRVEQHFSWSDKSQTARYWVKVNSEKPILNTSFVDLRADYKLEGRWQPLYQPDQGMSAYSSVPVDHQFERASAVLSSEQQALGAAADVVRWASYNPYGRMSIRLPNENFLAAWQPVQIPTAASAPNQRG